ncbi:SNF2 family N-terminal domain-containing protein [Aspergillus keveii]|uniref:SNF2 family N-terminal domain-containing protein n=1 Tax=Aspergillus keveii TaxID=714993 RepID=A0ABR4GIH2_9EURO
MSLKRLLNPMGSGDDGEENLWQDDYMRSRPRIEGPESWSFTTTADTSLGSFPYPEITTTTTEFQQNTFENAFDRQNMLFSNPFGPGPSQDVGMDMDPMILDQNSFLQAPSDTVTLSATSYTSTPIETMDEQYTSADVSMWDGEVDDAGQAEDDGGEVVCYGILLHDRVRLVGKGTDLEPRIIRLRDTNTWNPTFRINKAPCGNIFLTFSDGTHFGRPSDKMVKALQKLISIPQFEVEAHADLNAIIHALRAVKQAEAVTRVDVNVYGSEGSRDRVGEVFSKNGLFLQEPDVRRAGTRYDNPHLLRLEGMDEGESEEETREVEGEVDVEGGSEAEAEGGEEEMPPERDADFDDMIAEVYRNLRRGEGLTRLEGGENLSKALYPHQAEALDFMTQRETGNIAEEYRLWKRDMVGGELKYRHVIITSAEEREEPDESGGGILADEMGMGKSLTTLVLISKTMPDARLWVEHQNHLRGDTGTLAEKPCRATLVVVPSRVLINTWEREIKSHLNDSLKVLMYHGRSRKTKLKEAEDYDIVITTYNTLAKEHASKLMGGPSSPLHEYAWYRVVLDEAHMIRRRKTTFHRAVIELPAKIRWCLSGTPIQNTLDDLASLLAFIHIRPFHDPRNFRYKISSPFSMRGKAKRDAITHLTTLLEAICLRRTISKISLPSPHEIIRTVHLTAHEQEQYDLTNADMHRLIAQQAGEYKEKASSFGTFQIWLQLRSFCNHGTFQPRFSWAKRNLVADEMDSVRSLTRDSWDRCLTCREVLPITARDNKSKYVENCKHVLCENCSRGGLRGPREDGMVHCPVCESLGRSGDDTRDSYLLPQGFSSKMQALVEDVGKDLDTTKSIIFSCWTRTLDLISQHLKNANIKYERIDGKTLSTQRQKILDNFDGPEAVPVLIMTTGTGAFGLNLQSVNRIFIVEPQWNPSVESQAIARAIRLGQEQRVLVTRYRVKNSIEEDMCLQQMQKLEISKMDFANDVQETQNVVSGKLVQGD